MWIWWWAVRQLVSDGISTAELRFPLSTIFLGSICWDKNILLLLKLSIYLYTYIHIYTLSWVSAVSRGLGVSLISPFELDLPPICGRPSCWLPVQTPHPDTFPTHLLTVTPAPTIHPHGHLLCPGLPYPHHSPLATTPPAEKGERELGFQHGTRVGLELPSQVGVWDVLGPPLPQQTGWKATSQYTHP